MSSMREERCPPCRICGSTQWVGVWRPEAPEQTICIECSNTGQHEHENGETGHEFSRGSAYEVPSCIHCGMEAGRRMRNMTARELGELYGDRLRPIDPPDMPAWERAELERARHGLDENRHSGRTAVIGLASGVLVMLMIIWGVTTIIG